MYVVIEKSHAETGAYLGRMEEVPECRAPEGCKCKRKVDENCRVGFPNPKRIEVKLATPDIEVPNVMENYRVEPPEAFKEVNDMTGSPFWVYTQVKGHEWICGAKKADVVNHDGERKGNQQCNFRNS